MLLRKCSDNEGKEMLASRKESGEKTGTIKVSRTDAMVISQEAWVTTPQASPWLLRTQENLD